MSISPWHVVREQVRSLALLGTLLFGCLVAVNLSAMTAQVVATGEGDSRLLAIRDAQRSAIEEGLGVALHSETYLKDFMLQSDRVRAISSGVVTEFDVLEESQQENWWTVRIRAAVDSDRLEGNIRLLLEQLDNPVSMVVVDPYGKNNSDFTRSIHRQLNQHLVNSGFKVVNPEVSQQLRREISRMMSDEGSVPAASRLAAMHNADVTWVVEVSERQGAESYGVRDVIIDAACQVVAATSGEIFADTTVTARGINAAAAAKKAGEQLSSELVNLVKIQFADMAQQGSEYALRLWGLDSYRQARDFKKALQGVAGIEKIKQNSIVLDGSPNTNFVELSLTFKGSANDLIDQVFDGVTAESLNNLDLRLQRADQIEFELR